MKKVPSDLAKLISGQSVDADSYAGTSLSSWAKQPSTHRDVLEDIVREEMITKLLHELAPLLDQENIKPLVLGGVALWGEEYAGVGQRRVFDLDIWISPHDKEPCFGILAAVGFKQNATYQMNWVRGPLEIDLHTHYINNERGDIFDHLFRFDQVEIYNRGEMLPCCHTKPWRRPQVEDLFIQLAIHAIKHEFERINLVLDLHFLLLKQEPQTVLGKRLWAYCTPALKELNLKTPLSPQPYPKLAESVLKERSEGRPFLVGLRMLASLGEYPLKFWPALALGNTQTKRESGIFHRWRRVIKRL